MRLDLFDYQLDPSRIAQHPPPERDGARLLVVRAGAEPAEGTVRELARVVPAGALVVVNDTRVVPARVFGKKEGTGGRVELLLLERLAGEGRAERWRSLARSSKGMRVGTRVVLDGDAGLVATVAAERGEGATLEVELVAATGTVIEGLERVGHVPLPPYVSRPDDASDRERYQTVFARAPGAVAAPTAGLHLSERVLAELTARGVELGHVTLHVSLGTFQPVSVEDLDEHPMHAERLVVGEDVAAAIARARAEGRPVVAIGTTVVRALESAADPERPGHVRPRDGETRLLIQPGYAFRVVDAMLTNFHLPKSTLLALVSAFGGRERVLAAYERAKALDFRFFSYGDAMWLEPDPAALAPRSRS